MKNVADNSVQRRVLAKPELREIYHEELMTQRRARIEHERHQAERESEQDARLDALYARLGVPRPRRQDPRLLVEPAEAWVREHSDDIDNPQTLLESRAFARIRLMRLKAARRLLKEIGIK
jgi:hypothetical protein